MTTITDVEDACRNVDAAGAPEVRRARVDITVLGTFGVIVDGVPTDARGWWARRPSAALVKILALAPGRRMHREQAMDLLWPDVPPARSAPRLHKAAHFARRAAGCPRAIVLRDELVWLFPDREVIVDATVFERLAGTAVADSDPVVAREALSWYGGELLPDERYEDWAVDRRELLALRRLDVLRVAGEWRELAELDRTDEHAHVQLMRRHLAAGHPGAAIRQYEYLQRMLDRHLSTTPGPAVRQARLDADRLRHRHAAVAGGVRVDARWTSPAAAIR